MQAEILDLIEISLECIFSVTYNPETKIEKINKCILLIKGQEERYEHSVWSILLEQLKICRTKLDNSINVKALLHSTRREISEGLTTSVTPIHCKSCTPFNRSPNLCGISMNHMSGSECLPIPTFELTRQIACSTTLSRSTSIIEPHNES